MSTDEIEQIKLALTDLNEHFKLQSERLDSRENREKV